jgi:DNA-binding transcriptional ArsR family regulator
MAKQLDPAPDTTQAGLTALRHPLRRELLRLLIESQTPTSPSELSVVVGKPLSTVSYHVRVLADCAAVTLVDTMPVRGSMQHFYEPASGFVSTPWVAATLDSDAT